MSTPSTPHEPAPAPPTAISSSPSLPELRALLISFPGITDRVDRLARALLDAHEELQAWHAICDEVGLPYNPKLLVQHHRANAAMVQAVRDLTERFLSERRREALVRVLAARLNRNVVGVDHGFKDPQSWIVVPRQDFERLQAAIDLIGADPSLTTAPDEHISG